MTVQDRLRINLPYTPMGDTFAERWPEVAYARPLAAGDVYPEFVVPETTPNLSRPPEPPPAPLRPGSPRVADAPSDQARMGEALNQLARQGPPRSPRERITDAIVGASERVTPYIPPEVRGKVAAINTLAGNQAMASYNVGHSLSEGKPLQAAGEFASMIPFEGLAAGAIGGAAKLAAAGKLAAVAVPGAAGKLGAMFERPEVVSAPAIIKRDANPMWMHDIDPTALATARAQSGSIAPEVSQRVYVPGIYKDPRVIAAEAAANVAPEHPALKALFGVTRDDLWEIGKRGTRQGNIEPVYSMPANPGGSYAAEAVMNPGNAQRMVDILTEARKYPELARGMEAWYVMDPAFQEMVKLVGFEKAVRDYKQFNIVKSMFSPGSEVMTEINRGTAANMMINRNEWPLFEQFAGVAEKDRAALKDFPDILRDVKGHAYHSTAQAGPVGRYLASGEVDMTQPKVPLYMQASGVPATGFQTRLPVPDAHFTRGVGMSDVRTTQNPGVSMKGAEYHQLGPWFRENVARPLGLEAVPGQGLMWGTLAKQTGVETAVGAPKLELLAQSIWERAAKLGIDPRKLRDDVLQGKAHALWLLSAPGAAAAYSKVSGGAGTNEPRT